MNSELAWEMIRTSFRASRELQGLLPQLRDQCAAEEYKDCAQDIARAIHGINTALIDKALAFHPELADRIESELAEVGRIE